MAVSDRSGTIATPLTVVIRTGRTADDHRALAALVAEEEAELVVVGLPLSLDGRSGPAARAAQAEADDLATASPCRSRPTTSASPPCRPNGR